MAVLTLRQKKHFFFQTALLPSSSRCKGSAACPRNYNRPAVWNSRSTLIMRVTVRCSCRLQETLNERNAPIAIRNGETKDNAQLGHSNATKNYGLTKGIAYRGTTINYPSVHCRTLRPWHKPPTHAFWKSCSTNSGWSFWAASDVGHLADCAVNPTLRPKPNEARWIPASTAFTRLAQALTNG